MMRWLRLLWYALRRVRRLRRAFKRDLKRLRRMGREIKREVRRALLRSAWQALRSGLRRLWN